MAALLLAAGACGGSGSGPGVGEDELHLVTFNLLHGIRDEDPGAQPYDRFPERFPLVVEELATVRPTIVHFQEFLTFPRPGYPDVDGELLAALNAAARSGGRPDDYALVAGGIFRGEATLGESSTLGQATATRLPVLEFGNHPIGPPLEFRTIVHVAVEAPRGRIDLYNVHISGPDEPAENRAEMEELLAIVAATARTEGPGDAVVLGGDFNSREDDPVFDLLRAAGFVDLCAHALACTDADRTGCTADPSPLGEPGVRASRKIDYLWARADGWPEAECAPRFGAPFDLGDGRVLWASDHVAVDARIHF